MEANNPLEDIRNAILENQYFGIENEISQLGVSDELMEISDALDSYYGIVREKKEESSNKEGLVQDNLSRVMGEYYKSHPSSAYSAISGIKYNNPNKFIKEINLVNNVKTPLESIKQRLTKDNLLYLNISTAIASIAVNSVVSSINSFKPQNSYNNQQYNPLLGFDSNYYHLIQSGSKVFKGLNGFDMTDDFFANYETNRDAIFSMEKKLNDLILHPRTSTSQKSSSSGCMVLALVLSTTMFSCLGIIISMFL